MIVIGEKLNSSIPKTLEALNSKNENYIKELAEKQCAAGAQYLDLNVSMCENESEMLLWTVEIIKSVCDCKLVVDSPDPHAIAHFFEHTGEQGAIINSITLEDERFRAVQPLVSKYDTGIIALPISDEGIPADKESRLKNSRKLIQRLMEHGTPAEKIHLDILVEAVATSTEAPGVALYVAEKIRQEFPEVHITAGLSNISFGLPKRGIINAVFLCLAMKAGLSSAILDPLNNELMMHLYAANMLLGNDEYCMEYLQKYRELYD